MASLQTLPPGWECKRDEHSGRHYYINHYTKSTTWEDPRLRHRPFHGTPKAVPNQESIPLQHGSPELRRNYVYPSHTSPIPAFQMPSTHMSPKNVPFQDMKPRMSPLTVRSSKVQDSSLTTVSDTDEAASKIALMFPTVSDTHIKLLLKKYMKSIFPQADETLILEVLQNQENNIQKATDALKEMGYSKKDTVKVAQQKMEAKKEEKRKEEEVKEAKAPSPQMRIKSLEEKENMKKELQAKYKDVAEHLISIALESVNFDENRANQILQIMIQEDTQAADKKKEEEPSVEPDSAVLPAPVVATIPVSQSRQSLKSLLKEKSDKEKSTFTRVIEEQNSHTQSKNLLSTKGHDPSNAKGANEKLLLEDYVKWHGPNLSLRKGPQGLAKGPNAALLSGRSCKACGPNLELRKGPKMGLAKGSIFSQLKTAVVGEARGK